MHIMLPNELDLDKLRKKIFRKLIVACVRNYLRNLNVLNSSSNNFLLIRKKGERNLSKLFKVKKDLIINSQKLSKFHKMNKLHGLLLIIIFKVICNDLFLIPNGNHFNLRMIRGNIQPDLWFQRFKDLIGNISVCMNINQNRCSKVS